ncbi:NUDIX domain-containing protein [Akkermansia muciniphila]|uniref:NUDIX domain-containing protein n=1 Tax=Akkermansia muciniphila TaxID=239935 RepID=UPI001BFF51A0|nr:NUDIX domain-containing protein [Akkermansia muciniphila]MBT8777820.1 NUDIX domain-containing protein [Akkermansia muciniphila]
MERLYRPNVAGLMVRKDGKLLVCERSRQKGAWQFPQGGIDPGETALEAVKREVREEVGFLPSQYDIAESRGGYRYDYPPEVLDYVREKRQQPFVGQEQEYFLCRMHADTPEPSLDHREFCAYRWIAPAEFKLEWLPEFKKEVYARVLADFFNVRAQDR